VAPGGVDRPYPSYWDYTQRDYGNRVGIYRLMRTLDARGLQATALLNSAVATRYPALVKEIAASRWEVAAAGVDMGKLHHGGCREGVGGVRRRLGRPELAIQLAQPRNGATRDREVEAEPVEEIPLPARHRCVPLVEPERYPPPDGLMEHDVSELVAQRSREIRRVGPQDDRPPAGKRSPRPPARQPAPGKLPEARGVGRHHQTNLAGIAQSQPGPAPGPVRHLAEIHRQRLGGRPRDDGHPADGGGGSLALPERECEDQAGECRGISPPAAAMSSSSRQRFPQGLNLLALCPSPHAWAAASRRPSNQRARPSS